MDTKTFLEAVLGDDGYYCVWANRLSDRRVVQKFYDSIESVIDAAHNFDGEGYDAYYALGTFTEAGSREAPNVKQLRAFFLDLDCGPTKEYDSQTDALAALRTFCKQTKLPRPTLVNSGRGIHAYWPLVKPISREMWVPVAEDFKALCRVKGMRADPAVTSDAARILRVPATHNYKDTPPNPVVLVGSLSAPVSFEAFKAVIDSHASDLPLPASKYTPRGPDPFMDALAGNYESRFRNIVIKTAAGKGCAQIGEVLTNQENISEPLWRAGLSIAKFCSDADKAIHKISSKHPDYEPYATQEKADRIQGPYLCARFDEYRPGVCQDCSHWGKIKSPIALGREVVEASEEDNIVVQPAIGTGDPNPHTYVIPKYPEPYFRGKNGGVFMRSKGDDDEPKDLLIYANDLYVVRRLHDPELGESLVLRLHLPRDGVREFTIPLAAMGTKDECRKYIAQNGVAVLNVGTIQEYLMKWVNNLQYTSEATESRRQFGWTPGNESFVLGNREVFKDRIEINAPSASTRLLFPIFETRGTYDGWRDTFNFYNRPGMELHQYMACLTFGSVLMQFQPINACVFHVYSPGSGLGKTTAMYAGAAVWGVPDLLVMQERDTFNSKMNRAEVYKNVVGYMDEMTNTKPSDLSDWAYQLPSGQQRNRMGPQGNVERVRGEPWKMSFGSTGNASLIEKISLYKAMPQAEAQRILEYRATPVQFATKDETDVFSAAIKDNYGFAGTIFIQYVLNNMEAVKLLLDETRRKLDTAAGLTAENRFYSAQASTTIAGAIVAKRAGLHDFDIPALAKFIVKVLKEKRTEVREMNVDVESTLTDYLSENYNNMLRIKSTDDARKQPIGLDHLILPDATPRGQFVARYEYDVKKLFLLPKPFKTWCGKQQLNYGGIVEELKAGRTKAVKAKVRLGKGTHVNLPPTDTLVIDCSGFMTDETEEQLATNATIFAKQTSV